MRFDLLLILAAGVTQLAMGVMGIWWSFRPPKSERHWLAGGAFGVVGLIGLVAVVWAGIRNSDSSTHVEGGISHIEKVGDTNSGLLKTQGDLLATQGKLLDAYKLQLSDQDSQLKRIANAANVNPNQSASALASAIVQKLSDLDQRLHKVEFPPRDANTLYDGPTASAQVAIAGQPTNGSFTLAGLTSTAVFDFSKTYFLQTVSIKCDSVPETGTIAFGAESHHEYRNVPCRIVGKAPQ